MISETDCRVLVEVRRVSVSWSSYCYGSPLLKLQCCGGQCATITTHHVSLSHNYVTTMKKEKWLEHDLPFTASFHIFKLSLFYSIQVIIYCWYIMDINHWDFGPYWHPLHVHNVNLLFQPILKVILDWVWWLWRPFEFSEQFHILETSWKSFQLCDMFVILLELSIRRWSIVVMNGWSWSDTILR